MNRLLAFVIILVLSFSGAEAGTSVTSDLKDLYFGEALYHAYQGEWFDAISRLDTEIPGYYRVDEPEKDTLHFHINQATFDVGDFELNYRMHQRAGRAIKSVIEGNVPEPVRNEAIYRLARMYFQKDRPEDALKTVNLVRGFVPADIRPELVYLRSNIDMANGKNGEAALALKDILSDKSMEGFSSYNMGIALIRDGKEHSGREYLDKAGRVEKSDEATLSIKDKANLVLGEKLMADKDYESAKSVLDRVRIDGPFSNRALLGSGWADAYRDQYESALVPWTILAERGTTDESTEEAMLALPYAYGKLGVYSKAAVLYDKAVQTFGREIDRLNASITSIHEGKFLKALVREEIKQDPNWVVKLRELPESPETFYLLDLMATHDFQETLKNYLDLEELRKKIEAWSGDLVAFEDIIEKRKAYYQPLLPQVDKEFRRLDSKMRLRLMQRDLIEKRLQAMLTAPHPEYLATAADRIALDKVTRVEQKLSTGGKAVPADAAAGIKRLRGVIRFGIYTEYDRRFTDAHRHLRDLNKDIARLKKAYISFVRARQAATQSYEGYNSIIRTLKSRIAAAQSKVMELMPQQGEVLTNMAVSELTRRRDRITEYQTKAHFAMADSFDRATRAQEKVIK
jgi:tetratricopeptide (TPR) repeat protein